MAYADLFRLGLRRFIVMSACWISLSQIFTGKTFFYTYHPRNEVILPSMNRLFRHVPPVHVWMCRLKLDISHSIVSFQCIWRLVFNPVHFWHKPPLPQILTHFLVCSLELSLWPLSQWLCDDINGIEYVPDHEVFCATAGGNFKYYGMVCVDSSWFLNCKKGQLYLILFLYLGRLCQFIYILVLCRFLCHGYLIFLTLVKMSQCPCLAFQGVLLDLFYHQSWPCH